MANWIHKLKLKDLFEAKDRNEITLQELAKNVSERIRGVDFYKKYMVDLEPIADSFEGLSEDPESIAEDFDWNLAELYDWADQPLPTPPGQTQRKMCWIETF